MITVARVAVRADGAHDRESPGVCGAGRDPRLFGGTALGLRRDHGTRGYPRLGDGVTLYATAMMVGPVTVGDSAVIIGPHALVMHDVPPGAAVHGPRAEPVNWTTVRVRRLTLPRALRHMS